MEKDSDNRVPSSFSEVRRFQAKIDGLGRGGSLKELRRRAEQNDFHPASGTAGNVLGGGNRPGSKVGGFGTPADDGWNDDPTPVANSGRGGFGIPPGMHSALNRSGGGGFGSAAVTAWNDATPARTSGFENKGSSISGGFGASTSDRFGGGKDKNGSSCYKCGKSGHVSRECLQNAGGCRKCGENGHFAWDCPSGTGGSGDRCGSKRGCHNCGEEGHFARECPSERAGGKSGRCNKGCHKCGDEGHIAQECPLDGRKPGGCYKCGDEGHFARECLHEEGGKDRKGSFGSGKVGASDRCGEDGHFARECPKAVAEGEKPHENYIPPEMSEESLFKNSIHQGINFDKYDFIEVLVTGNNSPAAISTFEEAGLLPTFLKNVHLAGYTKPTPIQKHSIPAILAGRDLMGCAQTGSGKTVAFLLPVLTGMVTRGLESSQFNQEKQPQAVIVAPTRELANQIYWEAVKFSSGTNVQIGLAYGGTDRLYQKNRVMRGANLVVGTPGRLLDFIRDNTINLAKVQYLILDEADRMLDLGFEPDIRKLVDGMGMPPKTQRQTLMFSATFKEDIQNLASDFLNDYLFITVGIMGGACTDVTQSFLEVDRLQKRDILCNILNGMGTQKVLVFVGQKRNADFLASFLSQSGYPTTSIHGDRLQREREEALRTFKQGTSSVLIATNVAARGLDIPEVAHVINYDLPSDINEYVHRIGRTGRCGNLGKATSFYSHETDFSLVGQLVRILSEANQEVPDWLAEYASSSGDGGDRGMAMGRFASKDIRPRGKFDYTAGDAGRSVDTTCDEEKWD